METPYTQFGLVWKERQNLGRIPMASFMLSHFSYVLFPWLLSQGSTGVPTLLAEVTRAWEIVTVAEAARAMAMLAAEASA
jgi:hypothetical protein